MAFIFRYATLLKNQFHSLLNTHNNISIKEVAKPTYPMVSPILQVYTQGNIT